jgi:hypothetical protein
MEVDIKCPKCNERFLFSFHLRNKALHEIDFSHDAEGGGKCFQGKAIVKVKFAVEKVFFDEEKE